MVRNTGPQSAGGLGVGAALAHGPLSKRRPLKKVLILAMGALVAAQISATYVCTGKVESISQPWDGSITLVSSQIYGDGVGRTICNIKTT